MKMCQHSQTDKTESKYMYAPIKTYCRVYCWPPPVPGLLLSKPADWGQLWVSHVCVLNATSNFKNLFTYFLSYRLLVSVLVFLGYV